MLAPPKVEPAQAVSTCYTDKTQEELEHRKIPWPRQPAPLPDPIDLQQSSIADIEVLLVLAGRWVAYLEAQTSYAHAILLEAAEENSRTEEKAFLAIPKAAAAEKTRQLMARTASEVAVTSSRYIRTKIRHTLIEGRLRSMTRLADTISRVLTARLESAR